MKDTALWQRCRDHPLPTGPEGQDCVTWLAGEAEITPGQAKGLVRDYRRFCYLAASGALDRPVAAGLVGLAAALHDASGDADRFRRESLGGASWQRRAGLRRSDRAALLAAYEAEFGERPHDWYWSSRSRAHYWALAALLSCAGAILSYFDGSPALLALGVILALLVLLFAFAAGRTAGAGNLGDAARYGGGMGRAG